MLFKVSEVVLTECLFLSVTDIPWPENEEALSKEAVECVDKLLEYDPKTRADFEHIKTTALFSNIDWTNLSSTQPPFIPQPDDAMDTTYFEGKCLTNTTFMSFVYSKT